MRSKWLRWIKDYRFRPTGIWGILGCWANSMLCDKTNQTARCSSILQSTAERVAFKVPKLQFHPCTRFSLFSRRPFLPEWWNYKSHKITPHLAPLLHVLSGLGIAASVCLELSYTPQIFCRGGLFHTGSVFRRFTVTHVSCNTQTNILNYDCFALDDLGGSVLLNKYATLIIHLIDLVIESPVMISLDAFRTMNRSYFATLAWLQCMPSCQCSQCFSSVLWFCFSGLGFVCLFGLRTWSLSIFSQAYHFFEAHAHFDVL